MTILVLKNTVDDNLIIIHLLYRMLQFQNNNANTIITNYDYWRQLQIFLANVISILLFPLKK